MAKLFDLPEHFLKKTLSHEEPEVRELLRGYPPNVLYKYKDLFIGLVSGFSSDNNTLTLFVFNKPVNPVSESFRLYDIDPVDLVECDHPEGIDIKATMTEEGALTCSVGFMSSKPPDLSDLLDGLKKVLNQKLEQESKPDGKSVH